MGVVISRKTHEKLSELLPGVRAFLIDGSFWPKNVKGCGCCGPPPSMDYKVEPVEPDDPRVQNGKFTRVDGKVPVFVDRQLYDAASVARQDFVVQVDESTSGEFRVYVIVM
ncbi:MAG: hypothetical protein ACTSU5_04360 [Promethearchaeota archaeon]